MRGENFQVGWGPGVRLRGEGRAFLTINTGGTDNDTKEMLLNDVMTSIPVIFQDHLSLRKIDRSSK